MSHINIQLAPGLGDLLPGNFVVPQNPLHPMNGVRVPHMGELMPGKFTIPENPLLRELVAEKTGCGCRTGLGCPCAMIGLNGLGALDLSSLTSSLGSGLFGLSWTTLALYGGGALVLYMLLFSGRGGHGGGGGGRRSRRSRFAQQES